MITVDEDIETSANEQFNKLLPVSRRKEILTDPLSEDNELIVDSGCSEHMFNTRRQLTNYIKFEANRKNVTVANGSSIAVEGIGQCGILSRVYYVPLLSHCLLSVSALTLQGIEVIFKDDYATISPGRSNLQFSIIKARLSDNLYKISMVHFEMCTLIPHAYCLAHSAIGEEDMECLLISDDARTDPISNVHYLFGHPNAEKTRHICKCYNLPNIRKLEIGAFAFLKNCEFCRLAKAKRNSFKGTMSHTEPLGKRWYADVKGPFDMPSLINQNTRVKQDI
jgi:hypothetical protein